MKKAKFICCVIISAAAILSGCKSSKVVNMNDLAVGKYDLIVNGYDWGPGADKVILHCDNVITSKKIKAEDFEVSVETKKWNWTVWPPKLENAVGARKVNAAYLCNETGEKIESESNLIALELPVHPDDPYSNPFLYGADMMNHWQEIYSYSIKNEKLKLNISELNKRICPLADQFEIGESTTDSITLSYGAWEPENHQTGTPLIIWLHGMGEGGKDPYIATLGNKVVNLITPTVQRCFGTTGAYVLAPQTPGFWMQVEEGQGTMDRWISAESKNTVSIFTKALFNLINTYVDSHPDIDKNRIYIGGCSNGGYMTMNMILEYPDFFAAAYPVCQAYPDVKIDEDKLAILAKQHIWFTQSKDDKTVIPENYTIPTYKRLVEAGAEDVHLSLWESVTDQTDEFFDAKGNPYKYNGHFSWIYTLNNECKENGHSIFEWLSSKSK